MQDLSGRKLGQYELRERLGRGGMAEVYKSYQIGMDRFVAVKVMLGALNEDENFIERFRREARAVGNLRHPHIVQAIDFGMEDGLYYLAMEFVEGDDLKAFIQAKGKIPPRDALRIASQLADALAYAHDKGMVHRDLKPANVMFLDKAGQHAILTDFGIARIMGEAGLTGTGMAVGTPDYMSPEAGKGIETDHRTDIYALGIILYEMLVGEVPYSADTPLAVIMKHINAPLPTPDDYHDAVPDAAETIILRTLAKDPEDRFQSAHEMKAALDKALIELDSGASTVSQIKPQQTATELSKARDTAIEADKATEVIRDEKPAKNNSMLMGIGAVAVIAIVAIIAFFALNGGGNETPTPTPVAEVVADATETEVESSPTDVPPTIAPTEAPTDSSTDIPTEAPTEAAPPTDTTDTTETVAIPFAVEMPPLPENLMLTSNIAPIVDTIEMLLITEGQEAAIVAADEFLADNPDDFFGLFAAVLAYSFDWDEENHALTLANRMIEIDPDSPFGYIAQGHAYLNYPNFDFELATAAIKQAYDIDPENIHAAWRWAGFDDYENQLELLNQAEAAGARGWQYITLASNILYDNWQFERAIPYLYLYATEKLNRETEYWDANWRLLGALIRTNQSTEAYDFLLQFADQVDDAVLFSDMAYVAYRAQEWEQAKTWANIALALDGDLHEARYILALVTYWGDADIEAALAQFAELDGIEFYSLFVNFDFEQDINLDRARILTDAGRIEEGIEFYNATIQYWSYVDWLYEERADSYLEIGNTEAARADLQMARDITSDAEYQRELLQRIIDLGPAPTSEPED